MVVDPGPVSALRARSGSVGRLGHRSAVQSASTPGKSPAVKATISRSRSFIPNRRLVPNHQALGISPLQQAVPDHPRADSRCVPGHRLEQGNPPYPGLVDRWGQPRYRSASMRSGPSPPALERSRGDNWTVILQCCPQAMVFFVTLRVQPQRTSTLRTLSRSHHQRLR